MITLYFSNPNAPLVIDAVVREGHKRSAVVTDHPVEQGANISDHVRPVPPDLDIEGVISDYFVQGGQGQYEQGRAKNSYQQLELALDAGETIVILTPGKSYTRMILTRLDRDRTAEVGSEAIRFSATLKQIRTVRSQTVAIVNKKTKKANAKTDSGKKTGKPASAAVQQKSTLDYLHHGQAGETVADMFNALKYGL